jgi:hypothetical protein
MYVPSITILLVIGKIAMLSLVAIKVNCDTACYYVLWAEYQFIVMMHSLPPVSINCYHLNNENARI